MNCLNCQQSKIYRHVKLVPDKFVAPDGRFDHVHIDLVGPLPNRNGFEYVLTMIDRFSRWIEAALLREISAQTVARAFYISSITQFRFSVNEMKRHKLTCCLEKKYSLLKYVFTLRGPDKD